MKGTPLPPGPEIRMSGAWGDWARRAGGTTALARRLGCSPGAVRAWARGERYPSDPARRSVADAAEEDGIDSELLFVARDEMLPSPDRGPVEPARRGRPPIVPVVTDATWSVPDCTLRVPRGRVEMRTGPSDLWQAADLAQIARRWRASTGPWPWLAERGIARPRKPPRPGRDRLEVSLSAEASAALRELAVRAGGDRYRGAIVSRAIIYLLRSTTTSGETP